MKNKYTYFVDDEFVSIYINECAHFKLKRGELITMQSWVEDKPILEVIKTTIYNLFFFGRLKYWKKKYVIEFILKDDIQTTLEYDEKDKWKEILFILDKMPLY